MHDLIPLSLLAPGQLANVSQVMGRPDQVHRLEELGLRGGAAIEMVQTGSPCIIRLAGQKLCFRADELLRVLVRRGAVT
ncbi:MAG: FeoA domain-containing protein [Planctomycetia bacterium]|nr:FeoA domain-containing protein [Planctomycetia bacterium]